MRPYVGRHGAYTQQVDTLQPLHVVSTLLLLVHDCAVLDIPGTVRILERIHGLVRIPLGRADTSDHECMRVTSERVLQETRELRVTVRNVRGGMRLGLRGVAEGGDDVSESEKTTVDRYTLLDTLACGGRTFELRGS